MEDLIENLLKEILGGNIIPEGIKDNITMSPSTAFGGGFWNELLSVCRTVFMPFVILLLCLFVAGEFYTAYCKSNGELDIQLVSTTVFKFAVPFFLITRSYDLINLIYVSFNDLVIKLSGLKSFTNMTEVEANVESMMVWIRQVDWFEQFGYWLQLSMQSMFINLMGIAIFVVCWGRIFEIMLFWLVAPLPITTLVHTEHSQIGKNFLKMFMALVFQGILMYLCVLINESFTKIFADEIGSQAMLAGLGTTWKAVGINAVLLLTLVKSGSLAKRMFGTF